MKKFGLLGASGYVAPRHMKAIKNTNSELVAAMDPFDCVGAMDSFFPRADFFTEIERFDRHLDKLRKIGKGIDYLAVCSPNYLHDAHIRFGLRQHADVICEKPLVLNPWNVSALEDYEKEFDKKVNTILQLRLHPSIIGLKEKYSKISGTKADIELTYITSRGHWYYTSWKGNEKKSGGVATNIGIHFFDILIWIFGKVQKNIVHLSTHDRASGFLELENARVKWFLSINSDCLPDSAIRDGKKTFRSLKSGGEEWEFSGGFEDLHTISYQRILDGNGFFLKDSLPAIELAHQIRNASPVGLIGDYHSFARKKVGLHPFSR
jgi:UDP-N-acetyl-2-amino-2-deoxyglucuronate dehydrogenase